MNWILIVTIALTLWAFGGAVVWFQRVKENGQVLLYELVVMLPVCMIVGSAIWLMQRMNTVIFTFKKKS